MLGTRGRQPNPFGKTVGWPWIRNQPTNVFPCKNWRKQTSYSKPGDWVFASPQALGQKPYWPDAVLKRHVLPAAERAGIAKRIGWHTFRRTVATLLLSSGASVKTTQELMRHASPDVAVGIYAKALTAEQTRSPGQARCSVRGEFSHRYRGADLTTKSLSLLSATSLVT